MANRSLMNNLTASMKKDKYLYFLITPVIVYFLVFKYFPMYGAIIAFKDFTPGNGLLGSPWADHFGMENFVDFFGSYNFVRVVKNTLLLSLYSLLWGFPIPIMFALLLNEIRQARFKRVVQTVTYLPHFISTVIVVGLMFMLFSPNDGVINQILMSFGKEEPINFFNESSWFRSLYISSGIWQEFGWSSIIYIAAITSIDPQLYEAAEMDGAGRFRRIFSITLPGILPTIMILLILNMASFMNTGIEKVLVMQNPATYDVSDVIGTYVYRRGITQADFSYAAAIDLFNSFINLFLVIGFNKLSKKINNTTIY